VVNPTSGSSCNLSKNTSATRVESVSFFLAFACAARSIEGLHSISINLASRITIELLISDQEIILLNVRDHDAVSGG